MIRVSPTGLRGPTEGPLTQLVEYLPFKQRVAGSSPARPTRRFCPRRLARSRTPAFHAGNTGSNPVGDAILLARGYVK